MSVLSEIEKQKKHIMFSQMKDVESYYPDDVEVVPFELVRPLVEKLEKNNVELKVLNCVQKNTIISFKKAIANYCDIVEKYNALAKENADLKQKIRDFRKAVLNPKNNSMTLFEKFDELFAEELK